MIMRVISIQVLNSTKESIFIFLNYFFYSKVLNSIEETWSEGPELPEVAARYDNVYHDDEEGDDDDDDDHDDHYDVHCTGLAQYQPGVVSY